MSSDTSKNSRGAMAGEVEVEPVAQFGSLDVAGTDTIDDPAAPSPDCTVRTPLRTIALPYSTQIHWAVTANKPVFDNDRQRTTARSTSNGTSLSQFWQHPIRYLPSVAEKNLYRTVMIDFLPLDTKVQDVLEQIHTSALESIQVFPPIGNATDFNTARIVFHYELPARDLYLHAQHYGIEIKGRTARVWQVLQPTYPKNRQLDEDVFIHCYTRTLLIDKVAEQAFSLIQHKLRKQINMGFVVRIGETEDGIPLVEFTSVREATKAMRHLSLEKEFVGAVFDFENDYCNK